MSVFLSNNPSHHFYTVGLNKESSHFCLMGNRFLIGSVVSHAAGKQQSKLLFGDQSVKTVFALCMVLKIISYNCRFQLEEV